MSYIQRPVQLALAALIVCQIALAGDDHPQLDALRTYIRSRAQSPEDYVVGKFKNYDYVFVGEWHKIKEDQLLIQNLIPNLYAAGIYNLGIEFGNHDYQPQIDSVITAAEYDADKVRWVCFKHITWWGYQEYEDIYRAAWRLNRSLPAGARKFRVVALNYAPDFSKLTKEGGEENWKQVWYRGEGDSYMARMIFEELVHKGEKALIYSGSHHAFTSYHQPICDFNPVKFYRYETARMGNIVHDSLPDRVFNIFLHSPWQTIRGGNDYESPMLGIIDTAMAVFANPRFGFDCAGTPFGELHDTMAYYSVGYKDFKLADFCDGYIYQGDFCTLQGGTPDTLFVTEENLQEAIRGIMTWKGQQNYKTVADFKNTFIYYTDPAVLFPGLCAERKK
jgi:uncharacterized iron-regulated protein